VCPPVQPGKPGHLTWCHPTIESQWQRNLELSALGDETATGIAAKDLVIAPEARRNDGDIRQPQ